jgi:hypothetical protein
MTIIVQPINKSSSMYGTIGFVALFIKALTGRIPEPY